MQLPLPLIPRIPCHTPPSAVAYLTRNPSPHYPLHLRSLLPGPCTVRECTATGLEPAMRRPARKQLIGHSRCAIAHCIDHIPANRKSRGAPALAPPRTERPCSKSTHTPASPHGGHHLRWVSGGLCCIRRARPRLARRHGRRAHNGDHPVSSDPIRSSDGGRGLRIPLRGLRLRLTLRIGLVVLG